MISIILLLAVALTSALAYIAQLILEKQKMMAFYRGLNYARTSLEDKTETLESLHLHLEQSRDFDNYTDFDRGVDYFLDILLNKD